ncbi:TetR/AcrR family transcriptional regulator [bacterium]|nr:TetR/AcrR family transcriptional regulator [bacterium]
MGYTRKALATRARILDSAANLMFSKGFSRTKLLEVLTSARVQKGNFYYYFASKDELGLTVLNERGEKLVAEWLGSVVERNRDPWVNIQQLAGSIIDSVINTDAPSNPVVILALEQSEMEGEFRLAIGKVLSGVIDAFATEVERLQKGGRLSGAVDARRYGQMIFCLIEGAIMHHQSVRDFANLRSTVETGLDCLSQRFVG